jgi:hypothetical protein
MAYTQSFNLIAGRYGRGRRFLDPGRNAIGNRAAPYLANSVVRVGCRSAVGLISIQTLGPSRGAWSSFGERREKWAGLCSFGIVEYRSTRQR